MIFLVNKFFYFIVNFTLVKKKEVTSVALKNMFNENDDIEMNDRLNEVMYLQDDVSAIRRVENNHRRNERNRL